MFKGHRLHWMGGCWICRTAFDALTSGWIGGPEKGVQFFAQGGEWLTLMPMIQQDQGGWSRVRSINKGGRWCLLLVVASVRACMQESVNFALDIHTMYCCQRHCRQWKIDLGLHYENYICVIRQSCIFYFLLVKVTLSDRIAKVEEVMNNNIQGC